jgi:hypothetical protein
MLLDELQEHISERHFSQYINPNLLAAIYAATGRKMAPSEQGRDGVGYNDGENDDDNQRKVGNDDNQNDRRHHQAKLGKSHMYADEIDDNLDYGPVED